MTIITDIIPKGGVNRPQTANSCKYITIHETDNTKVGANAKSHATYIKTVKNQTSWHYTVDDKEIYQHIPDREKSFSTNNKAANEQSIAIEICVNKDGNFTKACDNAIELVRMLMKKYNIPVLNIKQHYDWSKKNCPKNLRKNGWDEFIRKCGEPEKLYRVQVGAFAERENAERLLAELRAKGYAGIIK